MVFIMGGMDYFPFRYRIFTKYLIFIEKIASGKRCHRRRDKYETKRYFNFASASLMRRMASIRVSLEVA